jgi:hypothetical protein
MDRATKERGPCKKQRSDISQYRPNHSTDRTSEVNNRFIIWLTESLSIWFSRELNRLSSVSLGNNIR